MPVLSGRDQPQQQIAPLPCGDPMDPGYRRLRYCRYADDQLLGFTGPKAEAEQVKSQLAAFLRDELALDLSAGKTLITDARDGAARFLGYEITVRHDNSKITGGRRMLNAYGPTETTVCASMGLCLPDGNSPPIGRGLANVELAILHPPQSSSAMTG